MKIEHPKKCPFCNHKLSPFEFKKAICSNCGASWVPKCSNCGKPTWMSLKGYYQHSIKQSNCGYSGYGN